MGFFKKETQKAKQKGPMRGFCRVRADGTEGNWSPNGMGKGSFAVTAEFLIDPFICLA